MVSLREGTDCDSIQLRQTAIIAHRLTYTNIIESGLTLGWRMEFRFRQEWLMKLGSVMKNKRGRVFF